MSLFQPLTNRQANLALTVLRGWMGVVAAATRAFLARISTPLSTSCRAAKAA